MFENVYFELEHVDGGEVTAGLGAGDRLRLVPGALQVADVNTQAPHGLTHHRVIVRPCVKRTQIK